MANEEHLALLTQATTAWNDRSIAWNSWRREHPDVTPDLFGANLSRAYLAGAELCGANVTKANLRGANLVGANLSRANLHRANLRRANLTGANLIRANLTGANLSGASVSGAKLNKANLSKANLSGANLLAAELVGGELREANLAEADLEGANLAGANLKHAVLIGTNLATADLTGCYVYGISAWDLTLEGTKQNDLIVTPPGQPEISVDNLEVAQFIYLLLHNEKIRNVIDTIGRKGVLLLGRFTGGRIAILERLREELRKRGWVPMVFNFDKPETKDFTETVRLLAGMSHFVIADITNPRSTPLELQATVPECMVPFIPILEKGEDPFAMFQDLWAKHREWVFEPIRYSSVDGLVRGLDAAIVRPALERSAALKRRKAEHYLMTDVEDINADAEGAPQAP